MRRNRRNGQAGLEFGGSGEDSFVAVVVTKLTGALLFILLLTMVIMALLPKAVDLPLPGIPRRIPCGSLRSPRPRCFPRRSWGGGIRWHSRQPEAKVRSTGRSPGRSPKASS